MTRELVVIDEMHRMGTASCSAAERRRFLAELKVMQQRGEIGTVWTDAETEREAALTGRFVVRYQRIREPRSKLPWYGAAFATGLAAVIGAGMLLWAARYVIIWGLLIAVVVVLATARTLAGHQPTCLGLHCAGCRG